MTGFYLALMTLTAYFTRLLTNQTPEPKKIGAQFIPVAALANISYAFNGLGYAAGPKKHIFEYNGKGNVASAVLGEYRDVGRGCTGADEFIDE
jgi:hypothetical protein